MKKATMIASLLIGFFGLTLQIQAVPQAAGPEIKQKVTKTARKAAAQARVVYRGSPQFAQIEGTSISYATNASQAVLKIGDAFYVPFNYFNPIVPSIQNVWLVSGSAHGPWVPAPSVPEKATAIVCSQINNDPSEPYQLCTLPRSS
ncbi:MAG TPA: hypothetical protein VEX69_02455 [Candidatus Limnocylindria bacterium]|nr:hypothetical protein [Candidatus Limnocylindria bacterium]